jgi:hypothetical protein
MSLETANDPHHQENNDESERRACIECGDEFDPRFSKQGLYCFTCSVHVACSCADE